MGLGTWELLPHRACRRAVADALAMGYRHVDTAAIYNNEEAVGEGLRASGVPRDQVFLTTKVWRDDLAPDAVRQSADASLQRLGANYVDLLLIHWPHTHIPLQDTLGAFVRLRDEGKTRHIGVSNFPPSWLERARAVAPIFCNQVEFHPYLEQDRLVDLANRTDTLLTAYCPLARGRAVRDRTLRAIGKRHGKTAAQVALRWLLQQGNVAVIPKAARGRHRQPNLDVFDFALTRQEMQEIRSLNTDHRIIDPPFTPPWEHDTGPAPGAVAT